MRRKSKKAAANTADERTRSGHERLERGDVDGAMKSFLDALAADPAHVPAMLSRLELLALHREDHVAAVAAGRVMRERGLGGIAMASAFSYSLAALDEPVEALSVIYQGLRTAPDTEALWYNAACLHAKLRQPREVENAISVATVLLSANGPIALRDEDFETYAQDPWFTNATRSSGSRRLRERPSSLLIAGETCLASSLASRGHSVETRTVEHVQGDGCVRLAIGLLSGDHDRVLVVDDGSDAARWTERELAVQHGMMDTAPPVALIAPTWLPTQHLPSFHAPDDHWGPGALGLLWSFLRASKDRPGC